MMASTSKSNQRNRDWLELPSDIMANIFSRLCIGDRLENAQKVCTAWRKISKDPAMWRVINMNDLFDPNELDEDEEEEENEEEEEEEEEEDEEEDEDEDEDEVEEKVEEKVEVNSKRKMKIKLCKHLVDRSQGQLVDLTLVSTNNAEILIHVAKRSCQLKRLEMVKGSDYPDWVDALINFPSLEELNLYSVYISKVDIEAVGRYCPMLKTFKVNSGARGVLLPDVVQIKHPQFFNALPNAIGETLHELRHLELIGSNMNNAALQVILDGCPHLETLDLRGCANIHLKGDLGKRCYEQIKYLKRPNDSLKETKTS